MAKYDMDQLASRIKAEAQAVNESMLKFTADLVRIQSYTGKETPAIHRTMAELQAIGCSEVWMDTAGNALGRMGEGSRKVLFNAHLDTNEVADEAEWKFPPLQPVIQDGRMYGLGASDCKAGVAVIVYAAAVIRNLKLADDFTLYIMGATLEEDAEGFAFRSLVERDGLRPEAVLICEASDNRLMIGQRGRCEIKIRTQGKAAHASHPALGENAILKMIPIIQAVEGMADSLPVDPVFGQDNQVVSLIGGPNTPNSVPSWCEITVDRRIGPQEMPEDVLTGIRARVEPLGGAATIPEKEIRTHNGSIVAGPQFFPAFQLPTSSTLYQAGLRTYQLLWGEDPRVDVWKFSTDAAYSMGTAKIPTIGFGPQEERYCHTPEDQVDLEKMRAALEYYALFPFVYCDEVNRRQHVQHI